MEQPSLGPHQWTLKGLMVVVVSAALLVVMAVPTQRRASRFSNERSASSSLKTIATAEADFRSNDRDNDHRQNFWVRDIYGLYAFCPEGGPVDPTHMIMLIEPSLATADATRPRNAYRTVDIAQIQGSFGPKAGTHYVMMTHGPEGGLYNTGDGRNFGRYAACQYPVEPRRDGRRQTHIMDETITIFRKDTKGVPVLRFPADLKAEGWTKLD